MPRYKISQHQNGWQTIENFVDAKNLDDAWEQYNKDKLVNKEWKVKEEEYKIVDTDINKVGDTPTEEVKKWREKNEKVQSVGYETQGYYIDLDANNKQDAHDKALDVNRDDWIEGNDGESTCFDINKKDMEVIK